MMIQTYLQQLKEIRAGFTSYIDIIWCTIRYGASPKNYISFGFKELTSQERATYVTNRLSRKMIKCYNDQKYIDLFEEKTSLRNYFLIFLLESGYQRKA